MARESLLDIQNLSVSYQSDEGFLHAVSGVDLHVAAGESVAIVGESGCGKTTLAMTILRLLPERETRIQGQVLFDGDDLLRQSAREIAAIRGNRIAMVFQDPMTSLNPYLRIATQVSEHLRTHLRFTRADAHRRAVSLLASVGIDNAEERARRYPHEFSGGMRQRVMLASALACSPDLLIADEPTTALDVSVQAQVIELLRRELRKRRMSLLLITHDLGVVARLCDRVLVMYAGQIVEDGTAGEVLASPCHPYTLALLKAVPRTNPTASRTFFTLDGQPPSLTNIRIDHCLFAERCSKSTNECRVTVPPLRDDTRQRRHRCLYEFDFGNGSDDLDAGAGSGPAESRIAPTAVDERPALTLDHVDVWFEIHSERRLLQRPEPVKAVNNLSLELKKGEILGLVGESGSGKSTVARAILRLVECRCGRILIHGEDIRRLPRSALKRIRMRVQLIFQDPYASLNPRMRAGRIIAEPLINFRSIRRRDIPRKVADSMTKVGLDADWADRFPHEFSGGQRQRIGIARALVIDPQILICDEPVSNLDVSIQAQILNLLRNLQLELGLTMLFISHDLAVVRQLAHRVAVMHKGEIVEHGDTAAIFASPSHPYTRSLLDAMKQPCPDRD